MLAHRSIGLVQLSSPRTGCVFPQQVSCQLSILTYMYLHGPAFESSRSFCAARVDPTAPQTSGEAGVAWLDTCSVGPLWSPMSLCQLNSDKPVRRCDQTCSLCSGSSTGSPHANLQPACRQVMEPECAVRNDNARALAKPCPPGHVSAVGRPANHPHTASGSKRTSRATKGTVQPRLTLCRVPMAIGPIAAIR